MKYPKNNIILLIAIAIFPLLTMGQKAQGSNCGNPYDSARSGGVGPYDLYDSSIPGKINIVLEHHFTAYMEEMALNGSTSRKAVTIEEQGGGITRVAGNLDYTLRAIPNHARALYAMGMLQLRIGEQSMLEGGWEYMTADCYFERAIMFMPDDGSVHLAYAMFRHKQGRKDLALESYENALRIMPDSIEAHYGIGLLYVQMEKFASAREHAWKAYEMGYPLPGLRNNLKRRGEWQDVSGVSEISKP